MDCVQYVAIVKQNKTGHCPAALTLTLPLTPQNSTNYNINIVYMLSILCFSLGTDSISFFSRGTFPKISQFPNISQYRYLPDYRWFSLMV